VIAMNGKIRELALLGVLACVCLGLAWAYDQGMFATLFAVEAAWAATEVALALGSG
jgi:hypothetical protein